MRIWIIGKKCPQEDFTIFLTPYVDYVDLFTAQVNLFRIFKSTVCHWMPEIFQERRSGQCNYSKTMYNVHRKLIAEILFQ